MLKSTIFVLIAMLPKQIVLASEEQPIRNADCSNPKFSLANTFSLGVVNGIIYQLTLDGLLIKYQINNNKASIMNENGTLTLIDGQGDEIMNYFSKDIQTGFMEYFIKNDKENLLTKLAFTINWINNNLMEFQMIHFLKNFKINYLIIHRQLYIKNKKFGQTKYFDRQDFDVNYVRIISTWWNNNYNENYTEQILTYTVKLNTSDYILYRINNYKENNLIKLYICFSTVNGQLKMQLLGNECPKGLKIITEQILDTVRFIFTIEKTVFLASIDNSIIYSVKDEFEVNNNKLNVKTMVLNQFFNCSTETIDTKLRNLIILNLIIGSLVIILLCALFINWIIMKNKLNIWNKKKIHNSPNSTNKQTTTVKTIGKLHQAKNRNEEFSFNKRIQLVDSLRTIKSDELSIDSTKMKISNNLAKLEAKIVRPKSPFFNRKLK